MVKNIVNYYCVENYSGTGQGLGSFVVFDNGVVSCSFDRIITVNDLDCDEEDQIDSLWCCHRDLCNLYYLFQLLDGPDNYSDHHYHLTLFINNIINYSLHHDAVVYC